MVQKHTPKSKYQSAQNELWAIYLAFKEFEHIFQGATKPVIIMTDSKSFNRFFQRKMIPPPLWIACDFV